VLKPSHDWVHRTRTISHATYTHGGEQVRTKTCRRCRLVENRTVHTGRKQRNSSNSGGGGGGGGGGFSGGSSSGGGSGSSWLMGRDNRPSDEDADLEDDVAAEAGSKSE
jgi:hypothetical protein